MPKLRDVQIETFDMNLPFVERVWHIRRYFTGGQPTLCGLLVGRAGEVVDFDQVGAEFICRDCLNKLEVTP